MNDEKIAYEIDEEPKPRLCITEKMLKGVSKHNLGDSLSVMVSGKVCELSKGYDKEKTPQVYIEIDNVSMKNKKEEK